MRVPGQRMIGVLVCGVGLVAFVIVAWALVPWQSVPGGMPTPVAADSVFTGAEIDRAEAHAFWSRAWSWGSLVAQLLVVSLLGLTGMRERLGRRLPGPWWMQVVLAVVVVSVAVRIATLPFSVAFQQHRLDAGLGTQAWSAWARDRVVNLGVSTLTTTIALVVLVALIRRWSRTWPAIAAVLAAATVVVGSWIYPVVIEPLFNSFEPVAEGPLRTAILELGERDGVVVDEVLISDASRRTTSLNAYVSGIGSTRRVVLYDTLVDSVPQDQVLAVVAHELSHAHRRDVVTGTTLGALGAFAAVGLLGVLLRGPRERTAGALVSMLVALVAWGSVLSAPVENGISRAIETRADVDALKATGDPVAFSEVQRMLALRSLADPSPPRLAQWWWGSHPTVLERLAVAEAIEPRESRP